MEEEFIPASAVRKNKQLEIGKISNPSKWGEKSDKPKTINEDIIPLEVIPDASNIGSFLNPPNNRTEDNLPMVVLEMLHILETVKSADSIYHMLVANTFRNLHYIVSSSGAVRENAKLMLIIKAVFHRYIVTLRHKELIEIYNDIFNDRPYSEESIKYAYIHTPSEDWQAEKIKEYRQRCLEIAIRKAAKRKPPMYEVGEIVGARDKEGKWWMSKVLALFEYQGSVLYYVEFLGWGEKFNEFISDGFRIQRFNPRKHKYFRPVWSKNNLDSSDGPDEIDEADQNS